MIEHNIKIFGARLIAEVNKHLNLILNCSFGPIFLKCLGGKLELEKSLNKDEGYLTFDNFLKQNNIKYS